MVIFSRVSCVVFPTLVGVFLTCRKRSRAASRLPHARGGVSGIECIEALEARSSPRSWGCFLVPLDVSINGKVFPTLVGVFLSCSL